MENKPNLEKEITKNVSTEPKKVISQRKPVMKKPEVKKPEDNAPTIKKPVVSTPIEKASTVKKPVVRKPKIAAEIKAPIEVISKVEASNTETSVLQKTESLKIFIDETLNNLDKKDLKKLEQIIKKIKEKAKKEKEKQSKIKKKEKKAIKKASDKKKKNKTKKK